MGKYSYTDFRDRLLKGQINVTADDWGLALVTPSYTFNPDHLTLDGDIIGAGLEWSGVGYNSGGVNIVSPVVIKDTGNDLNRWAANDVVFAALGEASNTTETNGAVVFQRSLSGRPLAAYIPLVRFPPKGGGLIVPLAGSKGILVFT